MIATLHKKHLSVCLIILLTVCGDYSAQWSHGFEPGVIPVVVDGDTLANPWVGGLTAPQWSPIDFDGDGDEDLFAFDRDGSRLLAFERTTSGWTQRPAWVRGWPEIIDWCLLRDYDCDGRPDIFTSYQNGIYVYRNLTILPDEPVFEPVATPLLAYYDFGAGPSLLPVICLGVDLPAILDHDGDGDLDIISFTENSSTLYRFQGSTPCGLDLTCTNRCYGMLGEASENNNLFIGNDFTCSFNVSDPRNEMHAGGSITSLQLDNVGPLDLLIGDITFPNSIAVIMEDAVDGQDSAIFVDTGFPVLTGGTEILNCKRFPAGFHIDVDNDGIRDLLFSPNTYLETDDDASVHFIKNTGQDLNPTWDYIQNNFLQDGMIDLGRGAYPNLIDLDNDGLLDLVITNKERYHGVGNTPTSLILFKNTGTLLEPVFSNTWQDTLDIATFGIESAFPALGDLDGDGDIDLILGDELGFMHRFDNVAGIGNWPVFNVAALSITENTGAVIDIGQFASPQLIDINDDLLLDLIVGEKNGTLTVFLNCGDINTPSWCRIITDEFGDAWGGIHVTNILGINGYSTPCLYQDSLGIHVLIANETGTVQAFGIADTNWNLPLLESNSDVIGYGGEGLRAGATFHDLDGDNRVDCLVGIQNGGILCYLSTDSSNTDDISTVSVPFSSTLNLYPNPGSNKLNWSLNNLRVENYYVQEYNLVVKNEMGHLVRLINSNGKFSGTINTEDWPNGFYIISVITETGGPMAPPVKWIKLD